MDLSVEQLNIVNAPIGNILVSAAAGSGKTTVLVDRIIDEIIDNKLSVDRILVVTFTKDAAANMRKKIDSKLKEKIKELKLQGGSDEVVRRLQTQLDLLPNSYIQTIDSFCTRVIREKGYVIADSKEAELIESGNSILDENSLKIILNDAIMQALLDTYESEDSMSEGFLLLTSMFGNGRTDDSLAENIAYAYGKLRSLPDYLDRCHDILNQRIDNDNAGVILGLDTLVKNVMTLFENITDTLITDLNSQVDSIQFVAKGNSQRQQEFQALLSEVSAYVDFVKTAYSSGDSKTTIKAILDRRYIDTFINDGLLLSLPRNKEDEDILQFKEDFGPIAALMNFLKPYFVSVCGELNVSKPRMEGYGDSGKPYQINGEYLTMLLSDLNSMLELQKRRTLIVDSYIKLIERVDKNYRELKGRVRGMDFADQSHLTKHILANSDAAEYYRDKFIEIYIDEYQDNSEIQDAIISCFERPSGNVFRVGDVKQSIYKFRYANPYMFLDRMNSYKEDTAQGNLFLLNANYRSNNQVLDFINSIFYQIMTEEGAEIEYDDSQALKYPDTKSDVQDTKASVTVVSLADKQKYIDGELVGVKAEVDRLRSIGVEYKDICILTRKHKVASEICKYLIANGHSAVYNDEVAIFDDPEIHGICNIIITVGNVYRDEYLLGVLLKGYRYSNFTLGEISRIVLEAKRNGINPGKQYLFSQLQMFAEATNDSFTEDEIDLQERVKSFLDWINDLRSLQVITDISELTDRIYRDTGVLGTHKEETEKFIVFKEWLCNNFLRMGSNISGIAAELENMKIKLGGNTSVRQKENEKKDAITCMTYHGSKGLEYKAVIVTELKSHSASDNDGPIKFNPNSGFAVDDYSESEVKIDKSIERFFMDEDDLIESNSEGIRLLYVALTRAMEYLCVVVPVEAHKPAYQNLYGRLRRVPGTTIPRQYWLNENKGIEGAFLAGLIRLRGSYKLEALLMASSGITRESECHIDYDDFDLNVITIPDNAFTSGSTYIDDDESDGEDDSTQETDVGDASDFKMQSSGEVALNCATYDENGLPVFAAYPYEDSSVMPFKVSVSQLKSGKLIKELPISLAVNDLSYYMQKQTGEIGDSASEVGTFVHSLLRFIDLEKIADGTSTYEQQVDLLILDGVISTQDKERAMTFESGVVSFATSDIGRSLIQSDLRGEASYEKPIVFSVPVINEDSVLVQGIIDCIFKDIDDKHVLIDYKTDRFDDSVTPLEMVSEVQSRHSTQVNLYAAAMKASGYNIKRKYIFLVRYGVFVEIY
ncbi:MAG: UvrD-helicase domain-containing protein [Saccharofermentans sp.]|nr:UvrD-helicase domain-containing protein [Saccharofermentans sp.]